MNADKKPRVSAIAAISKNDRGLGKNNDLIWKIPEDQKYFHDMTMGHPIISGRKNFEAMRRPLPGRQNIIVTRDTTFMAPGALVVHSVEDAITEAKKLDPEEVFIIGGGEIYKAALPYTDRLYLTIIDGDKPAEVFFPDYSEFKKVISEEKKEYEGIPYSFTTLER